MTQSRRGLLGTQELAATNARTFRTFLLMEEFARAEVGARIQQARKEKGLTQDDLAAMASFSKRALQEYENGVRVPYKHFRELGRLLARTPEWFLYGDPPEADEEVKDRLRRMEERLEEVVGRLDEMAEGRGRRPG